MNPEVFTVFGYFSGEKMRRKITFIVSPDRRRQTVVPGKIL